MANYLIKIHYIYKYLILGILIKYIIIIMAKNNKMDKDIGNIIKGI